MSKSFDSYHASVIAFICVIVAVIEMCYEYTHGNSSLIPGLNVWVAILVEDKHLSKMLLGK